MTVWKRPHTTHPKIWMGWTYGEPNHSKDTVAQRVPFLDAPFSQWSFVDQTHSDIVKRVHSMGSQGEGDAQYTSLKGLALVVQTADCVPIFLLGERQGVPQIGVVHAGWRGIANQITKRTIEEMGSVHTAIIGPCIGVNHYEVGEEVVEAIVATGVPRDACVQERTPRPHLDTRLAVAEQLRQQGVGCIEMTGYCTFKDRNWASYRRDGALAGRILSVIGILG